MEEITVASIAISLILIAVFSCGVRVVNQVWLKPKRLEKCLREQGYSGNSYRLLVGDLKEFINMVKESMSTPINLSDGVVPRILPYFDHIIHKYGNKSFIWFGPTLRVNIVDRVLIKEILSRPDEFHKPQHEPISDNITKGLVSYEGHKWSKHKKIINPAFHLEKLKIMLPAMYLSCSEMINKWKNLTSTKGFAEIDAWPYICDLSGDVISRTAFGSSYEEGVKIFKLQKEQTKLALEHVMLLFIPGWRFVPTKGNRRLREVRKEMHRLLKRIINQREEKILEEGCVNNDDLLGLLMESNSKEIKEQGVGISIDEVIEECKLFYFAGSETTSDLIIWTLVLLSIHSDWQIRAREEVLQVFGKNEVDFDRLSHLKTVTMILNEVLRLYSPAPVVMRAISNTKKLGNTTFPAGVEFCVGILMYHHDPEIWGSDVEKFKPERFSEGMMNKSSIMSFSYGPRACIGQNFAMVEAKTAIAIILQHFSFELSPSYKHGPFVPLTLQPQYGVPLVLHRL